MLEVNKQGAIIVNANMLAIKEFEQVNKEYKNDHKIFAFIYFTCDFKSPYKKSLPENEVIAKVKEDLGLQSLKITDTLKLAMDKYKELHNVKALQIFQAADNAIDQLITYFNSFNLAELSPERRDDIVNKVMKNISAINSLVTELESARKKVEQDIAAKNAVGQQTIKRRELPKHLR
jgi:hypothetical protein